MPLGQFRDTFIVAVDDEGMRSSTAVAHERILFERITERLTSGRLESQRLLEPSLVELSAAAAEACWRTPRISIDWGSRSRILVENHCASRRVRRCCRARSGNGRCGRSPRISRAGPGWRRDRRAEAHRGHDGVPRGGEGELPVTPEKMVHILDGCGARVLDDLSARPTGDAAAHSTRTGERFERI
jgi:hypothetical protein